MLRHVGLGLFLLLALAALACQRTADLIPGEEDEDAAGPAATSQDPVLPAAALRVSGGDDAGAGAAGLSDAELARSVVQIRVVAEARIPPVVRDGSGVVIDRDLGLILTSALVVAPIEADGTPAYDSITIATNPVPGGEPRLTHRAVLIAYDPISELAVLRIEGRLAEDGAGDSDAAGEDGANTGGPLLDEPAVTIGDSATLKRGDAVRIFGHPGLDPSGAVTPQAVMVIAASMTGARDAPAAGPRAWLKTDARLPHGSGGGPVFNNAGELVGIVAQIAYGVAAPVAHVRPIALAEALIAEARAADGETPVLLLAQLAAVPGTGLPGLDDGIAVSEPRFAREALEESGERELFDYALVFPELTSELHYEFVAQGVPNGATVQEFWYLDGVFQDELSATYTWELGPFALVSDRLASPNPQGNPLGVWTLEVWVDGALRAAGQAYLGVEPPQATVSGLAFGTAVSATLGPESPPETGAQRVLAFFDYSGAGAAERLRWAVFRNGSLFYSSPALPWRGGERGSWWVGMPLADGLDEALWEFELFIDEEPVARAGFELEPG